MKRCARRKVFKALNEYAFSNKILKTKQKHCRECMREFNSVSYLRRSEEEKEQVKRDRKKRMEVAQQYVWDYLATHPCIECGESNPIVLEFDHVNGTKSRAVSDLLA